MRASTAGGKTAGKDIVVTFGGLTWTPTYLSKDKSGDVILTLWLSDSKQLYNLENKTYDVAANKTFGSTGTSTWNAGTSAANTPTQSYPDNMYGTSYMNAVVLNNGGWYKPVYNDDNIIEVQASDSHAFAAFTTGEIAQYLDTPSQVTWQEYGESERSQLKELYDAPNENWAKNIPNSGTAEGDPTGTRYIFYNNCNYATKDKSNQWAESKLWLPSATETGYSDTMIGIWATSTAQRSNTYDSWLRSGSPLNAHVAVILKSSGSNCNTYLVYNSYAVRPALHLNLTEAAKNAKMPPFDQTVAEYDPADPTNEAFKDIYKITTEIGVDFHIKTAEGFLKLSEYSSQSGEFDKSWTFYLDNNITINADSAYTPIGSETNPFLSKFVGQNFTINFTNLADDSSHASLFGYLQSATLQNLKLNENLTGGRVYGLAKSITANNVSTNITHVSLSGSLQGSAYAYGLFERIDGGELNIYDLSMTFDELFGEDEQALLFASNIQDSKVTLNSCNFTCLDTKNLSGFAAISKTEFTMKKVQVNLKLNLVFMGFVTGEGKGSDIKLDCYESEFNINFTNEPVMSSGFITELDAGYFENMAVNFYDCLINFDYCKGIWLNSSNGTTTEEGKSYYSGVYFHDEKSSTTTILDPNFTSYKWCMDPHLNGGLPQLKSFVSVGEHLEQCDMNDWIASLK